MKFWGFVAHYIYIIYNKETLTNKILGCDAKIFINKTEIPNVMSKIGYSLDGAVEVCIPIRSTLEKMDFEVKWINKYAISFIKDGCIFTIDNRRRIMYMGEYVSNSDTIDVTKVLCKADFCILNGKAYFIPYESKHKQFDVWGITMDINERTNELFFEYQ